LKKNNISREDRIKLSFALGKVYDDLKMFDKAFSYYKLANELKNAEFDIETYTEGITRLIHTFSKDFVKSPESELKIICERLDIPYDPEFINRWSRYTKITGEVKSRRAGNQIAPLPRQEFEIGLLEAFEKNDDYKRSLDLLAYKHPE